MKLAYLILAMLIASAVHSQTKTECAIDRILDAQISSLSEPGLTVGVVQKGELIYHQIRGCMNLEYRLPFNDSTVFGLASVTKQFTSACIGVLEHQGKLSVHDDVRKHIPELSEYDNTIRIQHLLNHTSGIRNHNVLLDLMGFDYQHRGYTNTMIQELMFKQQGVNNPAGTKMLYSNTNYVLLALIVERVSGMPLHMFARQELFDPLEMHSTFYMHDLENIIENRAQAYYPSNGTYKQTKSLTLCVGAGGVCSTIPDLARWSQIFLDPNHPFSHVKEFITELDTLPNGDAMTHARGMFVVPYKGFTTYNHSGRDLGMRSQFICVPDKELAIVVYSNSEDINAVNVSYKILDLFIDESNNELRVQQQPVTYTIKKKRSFVGQYQELNSDLRMEVFMENDTLWAMSSFAHTATALTSHGVNSLCRIDTPSVVYTFLTEGVADADLLVDFGGAIFYFERINLTSDPNQDLEEFSGKYFSKELDVMYVIAVENNNLILSYPNNEDLVLFEGVNDTFGANRRTKYTFDRDQDGNVVSFTVASEGTVNNILFERLVDP